MEIKVLRWGDHPGLLKWALNPMRSALKIDPQEKQQREDTQIEQQAEMWIPKQRLERLECWGHSKTHKGEGDGKMKAEVVAMLPQAKESREYWQLPEA